MRLYGIGDLHLDFTGEKPMDIFGVNWVKHEERIFNNWRKVVKEEDFVLIPGDISWAMKMDDAVMDLRRIEELPGKKIISKGNHDYWWQTKSKLDALNLKTIHFIYNSCFIVNDIGIAGTRGWSSQDSDAFHSHDKKIFLREVNRLELSLSTIKDSVNKKIVMLHYPPFNMDGTTNEFVEIMKAFGVQQCVYGHLHSEGHQYVVEGTLENIQFHCIASDYINFMPKVICEQ